MDARNPSGGAGDPATVAKSLAVVREHKDGILALAFSPDRVLLASASRDGTGRIWDVGRRPPGDRGVIRQYGDPFASLAFAPNGRLLAAGSGALNGLVRLFDVTEKSPREAGVLRGAKGAVHGLAFSPDGKLLAGGGDDRTLRVWEHGPASKGDARAILPGHTGPIRAVAFAPDGHGVATAGEDGTVRLWSISRIRSWERAAIPHDGPVTSVAYAPDGKTLATACKGRGVQLWDLAGVKPTVRAQLDAPEVGVRLVLIPAGGEVLVSVGDGARVVNWDLHAGKPVHAWECPGELGHGAAFTPDGRYLGLGAADGAVTLYRVAEKRA